MPTIIDYSMRRAGPVAVIGLAVTGDAVLRFLRSRGLNAVAIDDRRADDVRARAAAAGVRLIETPDIAELDSILAACAVAVVSPGIPAGHPLFSVCEKLGVPVTTEIELASAEIETPTRLVAVTGTNGKTTVVTLITEMLRASGKNAVAAGNIGDPMLDVLGESAEVIVAETSSFQLALTDAFRPDTAVWLNVSPDHLDSHRDYEEYVHAKERIWANQAPGDVAVVNAEDPVVLACSRSAPSTVVTFGVGDGGIPADHSGNYSSDHAFDYEVAEGSLVTPGGAVITPVDAMARAFPHDLANALAASAAALSCGADLVSCGRVLREFKGLRHRIEPVAEIGGVEWFDDSKATTPAAVVAALRGFTSGVLIAGGRNKGLDMAPLIGCVDRVKAVVAIGEAAGEVAAVFAGSRPVVEAGSMKEAVQEAGRIAVPGDAVILSPGCASFDWYCSYAERGDDFARCVREQIGAAQ